MKEILDLKKKERLFIEKNIADVDREELKETYKVDDKTLDKIIQDGAHEGSPYITIPNFDLEVIDLVFSVHNYLTNTELEYDTIRKFLKEKQFISLSEVYYGGILIQFFYITGRIFTIMRGFKGSRADLTLHHLERLHPLIYPLTNVGTAGYLGTSTSQPDLFILGDENVIHPLTGVPCTLSTYSERVTSTSFKRESFQIGRFIKKDHPLDVLTSNDEKFNKLIRGASRSLGLTFESGALFSSMSKLEPGGKRRETLKHFTAVDMESGLLRRGRPGKVQVVRAFVEGGRKESAIIKLGRVIAYLEENESESCTR